MFIMTIFLTIIEVMITLGFMLQITGFIYEMKNLQMKITLHKILTNRIVIIAVNIAISSLMTTFTGANLTSGFANLGSSVIVAIFGKYIIDRKYNFGPIYEELSLKKEVKLQIKNEKIEAKQNKPKKKLPADNVFSKLKSWTKYISRESPKKEETVEIK